MTCASFECGSLPYFILGGYTMSIEFVPSNQIDERKWKHFIEMYAEDDDLVDLSKHSQTVFAYAAMEGEAIIGALFAWTSTYHPFCTYVRVVIDPATDYGVIGKELVMIALEHPDVQLPLQTSIWETSTELKVFYESYGFSEVRKTMLPALDVADLHVQQQKKSIYHLKTVDGLLDNEPMINQFTRLVKKHYEQTHLDNPIVDLPLIDWKKLILSDDLIKNASFVYVDREGHIVAYSCLHFSEREDTVELGWCGSNDLNQRSLIPELVKMQIAYAKQQGIQYVEGEFDTKNPYAMHVYKHIPFPKSTNWITYQFSPEDSAT